MPTISSVLALGPVAAQASPPAEIAANGSNPAENGDFAALIHQQADLAGPVLGQLPSAVPAMEAEPVLPEDGKILPEGGSDPAGLTVALEVVPAIALAIPQTQPNAAEPVSAPQPGATGHASPPASHRPVRPARPDQLAPQLPQPPGVIPAAPPADLPRLTLPARQVATLRPRGEVAADRPTPPPMPADPAAPASTAQPAGIAAPLFAVTAQPYQIQPVPVALPASATERPQDFGQLIDRLVAAREAAQPQPVTVALAHAEFGKVELRFGSDAAGLSVALSSADPDFARAVQAAVPPASPPSETGANLGRGQGGGQGLDHAPGQSGSAPGERRNDRPPPSGSQRPEANPGRKQPGQTCHGIFA